MAKVKVSFITTVLNEEHSIDELLKSLSEQSMLPDEAVIVDGGSKDKTLEKILDFQKTKRINVKVLSGHGNRSIGRNIAVKNATGDIIVCSDAGCILDKNWVRNIVKPFEKEEVDVVAGYYKGKPSNIFEKSLVPYVLVMEDKIDSKKFLPATRSIAFRKKVWEKVKGFDENFSNNEDFVFANRLKKMGANIDFSKDALVYWVPRKSFGEAFYMFYRFAFGDAEAGILRPKVPFIFLRYLVGLFLYYFAPSPLLLCLILYIIWTIQKNFGYVRDLRAFFYLPALQFLSDFAVMLGTTAGFIKRLYLIKGFR